MKKLIETLKNIWSIEELRKRILFTLLLVAIYRIGCYITLPGINPNLLALEGSKEGLLGLFNMFAGGAFSRASIFALGVMPYISASIFMQLAGIVVPQIAKMQREDSGRKKINQYTRYLTVLVTAFQASAYVAYLQSQTAGAIVQEFPQFLFWLSTVVVLTAGTLFVMWMGFYTALIFNPTEMADNLKRNNSFIPGVKPGEPTADYIATIMDRITLPGAFFLAIAGILPGIAGLLGVTSGFASFYGGTSMLIGVGVILDTLQQIESHLLMRQYDGLMKSGRITGRQQPASV